MAGKGRDGTEDALAVQRALSDLDLGAEAAQLDALGLTVVSPDKAAPPGFAEQVRDALLGVVARRDGGAAADTADGSSHHNSYLPNYHYLLFEAPIFEALLLQPTTLALVTRLLGWSCVLSSSTAILKGPARRPEGGLHLPLHSDNEGHPPPFPLFAQYANATWLLSDYTREGGCLCYVPGSHLSCRQPAPDEGLDEMVPVEAPMGSLVVWHGNTWHGAFRRRTKGLRMGISFLFARKYLLTREPYREDVTAEALARNPPRFATLMGQQILAGWRGEGPDYARVNHGSVPNLYA